MNIQRGAMGLMLLAVVSVAGAVYGLSLLPSPVDDITDPAQMFSSYQPTAFEQTVGRWTISGWPQGMDVQAANCSMTNRDSKDSSFTWTTFLKADAMHARNILLVQAPDTATGQGDARLSLDDQPAVTAHYEQNALGTATIMLGDNANLLASAPTTARFRVEIGGTDIIDTSLDGIGQAMALKTSCLKRMANKTTGKLLSFSSRR